MTLADLRPRHLIMSLEFADIVQQELAHTRGSGVSGGSGRDKMKPKHAKEFVVPLIPQLGHVLSF